MELFKGTAPTARLVNNHRNSLRKSSSKSARIYPSVTLSLKFCWKWFCSSVEMLKFSCRRWQKPSSLQQFVRIQRTSSISSILIFLSDSTGKSCFDTEQSSTYTSFEIISSDWVRVLKAAWKFANTSNPAVIFLMPRSVSKSWLDCIGFYNWVSMSLIAFCMPSTVRKYSGTSSEFKCDSNDDFASLPLIVSSIFLRLWLMICSFFFLRRLTAKFSLFCMAWCGSFSSWSFLW